jgi:DNA invertase Pin-like site-specific DNA recombinase
MKDAIAYLRVSTKEQGRSGLGLAAQRRDIEAFGAREGFTVKNWHQDIQTGAGKDALLLRPGLAAALREARAARCPLLVSRLDRLSRNVHFITGLMEHKVHFIVAMFGPNVDNFTLHIYASLAEQERKMISERLKAAFAIAKAKGKKFGLAAESKAHRRRVSAIGRACLVKATNEWTEAHRAQIEWALRQPGKNSEPISFRAAARKLNELNVETPMRRSWTGHQLHRSARRLGLNHPIAWLEEKVVRDRVFAIWKDDPMCKLGKVIDNIGLEHRVGQVRALRFLQKCRKKAAKRSAVYGRLGWPVDRFTATRIRIAEILKQNPNFIGKQVVAELGTTYPCTLNWAWKVMAEVRGGAAMVRKHRQDNRRWNIPKKLRLQARRAVALKRHSQGVALRKLRK